MKRVKKPSDENALLRKTISDILQMREKAKKLLLKSHQYNGFLLMLLELDEETQAEVMSDVTKLCSLSGESADVVKETLGMIYVDLISIKGTPIEFNKVDVIFSLNNKQLPDFQFLANPVPVIPKVGEQVHIPFFTSMADAEFFQVERVTHFFTEGNQQVYVELKPGSEDGVWESRRQKSMLDDFYNWFNG